MSNILTYVLFKDVRTDSVFDFNPARYLNPGETLTSLSVQAAPYPATTPPLTVTIANNIQITLAGGRNQISYGCPLELVTSTGRVVIVQLAVTVGEASLFPNVQQDGGAFADLVDTIQAGNAAQAVASFVFEPSVNPAGGFVTWKMLNTDGTVVSAGTAYDYRIRSTGQANIVQASCVVSVPSSVTPSSFDTKYQIQYNLFLNGALNQTVSESITVIGLSSTPLGTVDLVEFKGNTAPAELVTQSLYQNVQCRLQYDNTDIGFPLPIYDFERVDSGYLWRAPIDTNILNVSIDPYVVLWSYWNNGQAAYTEYAKLFVVNASILDAISDVQARVNKARTTLYGSPDLLFPPEVIMTWLRRGKDYFNGATGQFVQFSMINAKNIIREYWLQSAEMMALESQELAEAEKAFNFSGANISLEVDRTNAYSQAAQEIKSRLEQDLKIVKQNLITKGNIMGDGSVNPGDLQHGATGSVGITLSPATPWGRFPGTVYGGRFGRF